MAGKGVSGRQGVGVERVYYTSVSLYEALQGFMDLDWGRRIARQAGRGRWRMEAWERIPWFGGAGPLFGNVVHSFPVYGVSKREIGGTKREILAENVGWRLR